MKTIEMSVKQSFFILSLIILITFICSPAEAITSWLSSYSHRVRIPVNATAAGAQTDYQMQIVLHSESGDNSAGDIYLNDNLQDTTNFNDIRFTASDGTTLKDFWIQKVEDETGGRKATVYVEINTPASDSTDYYIYYEKSGDTSASNYDNTFTKDYGESGLAGLWHMDEGTAGTTADSSGNSNDGTIYGASGTDTDGGQWDGRSDVRFSTGSALSFDGVNDYVSATIPQVNTYTIPVTISAWIYVPSSWTWTNGAIALFPAGSYGMGIFRSAANNMLVFAARIGGTVSYGTIGYTIQRDTWYHLVFVGNGATFDAYVNGTKKPVAPAAYGVLAGSDITGAFRLATNTIYGGDGGGYFNGIIDEVRIYNRALSADEISRYYIRSKYASPSPDWAAPGAQQSYALAVITQSATYIDSTSATLNGYLGGLGGDSSAGVYFKWGLSSDNLDQITASSILTDSGSFSKEIVGLSPDTTYYFQAFVENSSETAQGSIVSFKTEVLETDYYGIIINTDGSLTFTNKDAAAAILSSAPRISLSYLGHGTVSNGNNLDSTLSVDGDFITITSVDDTNPYAQITHQYELNTHSPYINYTATFEYKQDVYVAEERFDFVVPSRNAQVMTRNLQLASFNTSNTYWSDIYTPKVVRFANGLSFLGSDTMESMRLRTSGSNSKISFYSDYGLNHPHFYYIKYGGGATASVNETQRFTNDTYSASVTFAIDTNECLPYLIKTRQPYGYDAVLTLTNHPDGETLDRIKAVAYGSENESDPDYGTRGIAARGIGWTKGVFVSGQTNADLSSSTFKALIDQLYQDGVVIVGHSITPYTDSRAVVAAGLTTLSQYNPRGWIDHSASGGTSNWEDLASQGAIKGSAYYILDLLDQYNYQYAWSYIDLTTDNYALNMLKPSATSDIRPFLFYNNRVDDNVYDNKKIYLWSTINTNKTPDLFYTNGRVDTLISERGVHIGHEYFGYLTCENHTWYNNYGTIEIYPTFDSQLEYIAGKRAAGLLWSPTRAELGDYLVPLKDVLVTYNSDGTVTVTNNSLVDVTGITLLAENDIQSVTIDNYDLVSFGGSYGDKEIVLPTIASGGSVVLNISYGTKDSSVPTIASNDTGKNKVNEITGYWDGTNKILTMTAEGRSGNYSFTVTIPSLANKTIIVKDVTINTTIGQYDASDGGTITFTASLDSLHTFKTVKKPFATGTIDDFDSYESDGELQNVWHSNPTLVWLNTDSNFVREGNSVKYEYEGYAEVGADTEDLPCQIGSDWTLGGVKALVLYFYGAPSNSVLPMYVKLEDDSNNVGTVTYGDHSEDPNDLRVAAWHEWNIDLKDFNSAGVNLTNVKRVYLGFSGSGSGTVYFDDIRLYLSRCVLSKRSADFAKADYAPAGDPAGDCVIDYRELEMMADNWLMTPPDPNVDLYGDGVIDFRDFAVLAEMWLEKQLWPPE